MFDHKMILNVKNNNEKRLNAIIINYNNYMS